MFKDKITKLTSGAVLLASASSFTSSVQANPGSTFSGSEKLAKELQNSSFFRNNPVLGSVVGAVLVILGVTYALILLDKWARLKILQGRKGHLNSLKNAEDIVRFLKLREEINASNEIIVGYEEDLKIWQDERVAKQDALDNANKEIKDLELKISALDALKLNIDGVQTKISSLIPELNKKLKIKAKKKELEKEKEKLEKNVKELYEKQLETFLEEVKKIENKNTFKEEKGKIFLMDTDYINSMEETLQFKDVKTLDELFAKKEDFRILSEKLKNVFNHVTDPNRTGFAEKKYVEKYKNNSIIKILLSVQKINSYIDTRALIDNLEKEVGGLAMEDIESEIKRYTDEIMGSVGVIFKDFNDINKSVLNELKVSENEYKKYLDDGIEKGQCDDLITEVSKLAADINEKEVSASNDIKEKEREVGDLNKSLSEIDKNIKLFESCIGSLKPRTDEKEKKMRSEEYDSASKKFYKLNEDLDRCEEEKEKIEQKFWYPNSFPGQHSLFS